MSKEGKEPNRKRKDKEKRKGEEERMKKKCSGKRKNKKLKGEEIRAVVVVKIENREKEEMILQSEEGIEVLHHKSQSPR